MKIVLIRGRFAMALAVVLLASGVQAFGAEDYPFLGRWGGEHADCSDPFVFTGDGYTAPGSKPMKYQKVRREGSVYTLSFADGYKIQVSRLKSGRLSWLSEASGDGFELTRCKGR